MGAVDSETWGREDPTPTRGLSFHGGLLRTRISFVGGEGHGEGAEDLSDFHMNLLSLYIPSVLCRCKCSPIVPPRFYYNNSQTYSNNKILSH